MMSAEHATPTPAPLYGLVLSGGASKRMHTDKAALRYQDSSWLALSVAKLDAVTRKTFVSIRAEQRHDPLRAGFNTLEDAVNCQGPMAGILTALQRYPEVAWLVLAVDLPVLHPDTLRFLIQQRDATQLATAFRSESDQLPEPLCAIYEPAAKTALESFVAEGKHCPRKFLLQHAVRLLTQPTSHQLDNINTPADWQRVLAGELST
jgi:molybdenum cofactor guanylyltransferase